MFNLKKFSQIKPTEKMLMDNREQYDLPKNDELPVITDKQLKDGRESPDGDKITEKQLGVDRVASGDKITEKQLNSTTGTMFKHRRDDKTPLIDMGKKTSDESSKAFAKANKEIDEDTKFWDAFIDIGKPKIIDNAQSSQLLSNYDSREEFLKQHPSFNKKAMSQLSDADAMLFHIYKTASRENRSVTDVEQQMINDINANKIKILIAETRRPYNPLDPLDSAAIPDSDAGEPTGKWRNTDNAAEDEFRADQADITGDQMQDEIDLQNEDSPKEMFKKDKPNRQAFRELMKNTNISKTKTFLYRYNDITQQEEELSVMVFFDNVEGEKQTWEYPGSSGYTDIIAVFTVDTFQQVIDVTKEEEEELVTRYLEKQPSGDDLAPEFMNDEPDETKSFLSTDKGDDAMMQETPQDFVALVSNYIGKIQSAITSGDKNTAVELFNKTVETIENFKTKLISSGDKENLSQHAEIMEMLKILHKMISTMENDETKPLLSKKTEQEKDNDIYWASDFEKSAQKKEKLCNKCKKYPALDSYNTCKKCHEKSLDEAESYYSLESGNATK